MDDHDYNTAIDDNGGDNRGELHLDGRVNGFLNHGYMRDESETTNYDIDDDVSGDSGRVTHFGVETVETNTTSTFTPKFKSVINVNNVVATLTPSRLSSVTESAKELPHTSVDLEEEDESSPVSTLHHARGNSGKTISDTDSGHGPSDRENDENIDSGYTESQLHIDDLDTKERNESEYISSRQLPAPCLIPPPPSPPSSHGLDISDISPMSYEPEPDYSKKVRFHDGNQATKAAVDTVGTTPMAMDDVTGPAHTNNIMIGGIEEADIVTTAF